MEREENKTGIEIENELDRARAARWRAYAETELERIRHTPAYGSAFVPFDAVEAVEGMDMADVIVCRLCRDRGIIPGANGVDGAALELRLQDVGEEELGQRNRDRWERYVATEAARMVPMNVTTPFAGEELARFVRRYWHPGDYGLHPAVVRALRASLDPSPEYRPREAPGLQDRVIGEFGRPEDADPGTAWVRMAEEATRSILLTAEDHEAIAAETRGGTVRVGPFTPSLRRKIEKVRAGRSLPTFEAALEHLARELFRREDRRRKERGTDGRGDAGRAPTV